MHVLLTHHNTVQSLTLTALSGPPLTRATGSRSFPIADHFNALGVANKQDYARRHGWEVHLSAENVDPTAIVRDSFLLKARRETRS